MHDRSRLPLFLVALAIAGTLRAADPPTGIQIPVIVNIYETAPGTFPLTEAQARDAVKSANAILKQADLKLVVVKVNRPPGAGNGDNGNGDFTATERGDMRTFGGKELKTLDNKKGIKVSFGRTPVDGGLSPGISVHKDPTIILKWRGNADDTGSTLAHELGHVMTLVGVKAISGTVNSDASGHAPADANGDEKKGNLMCPSIDGAGAAVRNGTHLTANQIAEMKERRLVHGKCATQFLQAFPAEKVKQGYGGKRDEAKDQGAGNADYYDVGETVLTTLDAAADIDGEITLNGLLPVVGAVNARYSFGFNADGNIGSGTTYGGLAGIDKIVRVDVSGLNGVFSTTGEVETVSPPGVQPLPTLPQLTREDQPPDQSGAPTPIATTVAVKIPKAMLGLSAALAPMVATAGISSSIYDTAEFEFDSIRWQRDATLTTFGTGIPTPGSSYPFAISGLLPNSPYTLYVDDTNVLSSTLDGSGAASGAFIFPSSLSNATPHFLTAQDSTGEFAYSISCPLSTSVPALSGWGLLVLTIALGSAMALMLRRRKVVRPG